MPDAGVNDRPFRSDLLVALAIFAATLAVFSTLNWSRELVRLECRFMVFVQQMDSSGSGLGLFPTLYGRPYTDYPVTYTALAYAISRLTGGLSTFALTFPVSFCAALSVALTYLIGAARSMKLGLCAAFVLMTTLGMFSGGRSASIDAFVCLSAVACFLFAQISSTRQGLQSALCHAAAMLFVVFAFLMRGPIGSVIASAAFIAFFAGGLEWGKAFRASVLCGAVFAICTGAFFYLSWLQGGDSLLSDVVHSQVGGRVTGSGKNPFFYFLNGMGEYAIAFPLAVLALVFARRSIWRKSASDEIRFLGRVLAWGFVIVLGLSVPSTKHLRYILPAAPAFALAAACLLCHPSKFELPSIVAKSIAWLSWRRLLLAACLFSAIVVFVVERIEVKLEESRSFVSAVAAVSKDPASIVFYQIGPDGEELKYLCNVKGGDFPSFVSSAEALQSESRTVISTKKSFDSLPQDLKGRAKVLASGDLGHKRCVAFLLGSP